MNFSSGWTGTLVASSGGTSWALGGMHSGCGLSPCGDQELVVLGITCTAAVCELLWLGNRTVCSCGGGGGGKIWYCMFHHRVLITTVAACCR